MTSGRRTYRIQEAVIFREITHHPEQSGWCFFAISHIKITQLYYFGGHEVGRNMNLIDYIPYNLLRKKAYF